MWHFRYSNKFSWECHTRGYKLSYASSRKLELDTFSALLSKTEPEWHRTTFWGEDTAQKESILGGDTTHTLLMGGIIGVGTLHNIERTSWNLPDFSLPENPRWSPSVAISQGWYSRNQVKKYFAWEVYF